MNGPDTGRPDVEQPHIERYPYPYRAALAFVSDIDETTVPSLLRTYGCLLGTEPGWHGVGLEVTSSMWLMAGPQQSETRSSIYALELDGTQRAFVKDRLAPLLRSPLFDTLHTYGDFQSGFTRAHAQRCAEFAEEHGIRPRLWTFHGSAGQTQNIRPGDQSWTGDDPASDSYHLDLAQEMGVRFVRVPPSLDIHSGTSERHVVEARDGSRIMTVTCHATMQKAANRRHMMDWLDQLAVDGVLGVDRSQIIQGSRRFPHKLLTWHPELLPFQLNPNRLQDLVDEGRTLYLNQHLSRARSLGAYEMNQVRGALRRLTGMHNGGDLLVCGPARLMTYELVRDHVRFDFDDHGSYVVATINPVLEIDGWRLELTAEDLEGLTVRHRDSRFWIFRLGTEFVLSDRIVGDDGTFVDTIRWRSRVDDLRDALAEFARTFGDDDG